MLKTNLKRWTAIGILAAITTFVQAQGIEFEHGTWDEVKAIAQKEKKPIFVDAYTTWCGPCKWMANNIFVKEEVGAYMKANYISYKMDMEKGEGPAFAKTNNVMAYPTLLYFSSEGELIHKGVGARDADGLVALCNDALDPNKQLMGFISKYDGGNRDKTFLQGYLKTLSGCGEDISEQFKEFWGMTSDAEKQTEDVLEIMATATNYFSDFKNPVAQYLINNKVAYEAASSKEKVAQMLSNCYINSTVNIARNSDTKIQKTLGNELVAIFPEHKADFSKYLAYLKFAVQETPDEAKLQKAYLAYIKVSKNANDLNSAAWNAYESTEDPKELKQALGWVNRSIEIEKQYNNVDTKAALLFKLKEYEEAKKTAEEAIKISEETGMGTPEETVKLLENIKAKLGNTASK